MSLKKKRMQYNPTPSMLALPGVQEAVQKFGACFVRGAAAQANPARYTDGYRDSTFGQAHPKQPTLKLQTSREGMTRQDKTSKTRPD